MDEEIRRTVEADAETASLDELEAAAEILDKHVLIGLSTLLDKRQVDVIFSRHDHQFDVLYDLYKAVLPELQQLRGRKVRIHGWPKAGKALWKYIASKFMDFDREHHPNGIMRGGLWMNNGFSVHESEHLHPWEVTTNGVELELMED